MQRLILPAVILLLIQIGFIISVASQNKEFEPYTPNTKLVNIDPSAADTIQISSEDSTLNLTEIDGTWVLSEENKIPVNSQQVESFLDTIAGIKRTLAVGTTENAAKRLKVSDDNYNYHLIIKGGGIQLADLYFGTSPGFKQIHLRVAGTNEIITAGLASHELSPEVEQWIDKDQLKLAGDAIQRIEIDDDVLEKNDDSSWKLVQADNSSELNKDKIDALLDKVAGLSVNGFVVDDEKQSLIDKADLTYSITLTEGKKLDLKFKQRGENEFVVYRSDIDYGLKVSKWQIDELQKAIDEIFGASPKQGESIESSTVQ